MCFQSGVSLHTLVKGEAWPEVFRLGLVWFGLEGLSCGLRLGVEVNRRMVITLKYCRPGHVEVRWVPDNSGMRVGPNQEKKEKMERETKEEEEVGSKQNMDELDKVEKKTMDKVEAEAKELKQGREDL